MRPRGLGPRLSGSPGFHGQSSFATWFYRIVTNVCLGRLRHRRPPCLTLEGCLERVFSDGAERRITEALFARQVLAQLSPELRVVLVLREQGTLSYREISEAIGFPVATVRSRLRKARIAFRKVWNLSMQSREGTL